MHGPRLPGGVVHRRRGDRHEALAAAPTAGDAWVDNTPRARNGFICGVEAASDG